MKMTADYADSNVATVAWNRLAIAARTVPGVYSQLSRMKQKKTA